MSGILTRRTFLQSSAIATVLAGTGCAQPQTEAAVESEKHAQGLLDKMSAEQKVAQMIVPCLRSFEGVTETVTELSQVPAISEALRRHQYGGVILFGANIEDTEQTTRLVYDLQENNAKGAAEKKCDSIPYLVAADQEGGSVARVSMGTRGTGSMALGATGEYAEKFAYGTGEIFAQELSALGINLNLGPCADVITDLADPGMSTRVFSDDPDVVANMGLSFKSGVDVYDVITCFKHFPGAGDGSDYPTATKISLEDLREQGLKAYKHVIESGAEMVMVAATTFPTFDDKYTLADGKTTDCYPATMSPKIVTDILRKELGFEGVVITDALDMDQFFLAPETGAQLVPGERGSLESMVFIAQKCIEAGCDLLLMPRDMTTAEAIDWYDGYIQGIVDLVEKGTLSEERINESVKRILSLKETHSLLDGYINGNDIDEAVSKAKEVVGSPENHEAERGYAEWAITMLKNEGGILPIPASTGKIVIAGRLDKDDTPITYALAELDEAGVFASGLYVNDLISGEETGSKDAGTKITIGSYYALSDEGEGSLALSDGLLPAISEANFVICNSTVFSGIDALQDDHPCAQGVTQILEAAHAAGAKFVLLSDGTPVDAVRYTDADAIVCAYLSAGFDVDPTTGSGSEHMRAINANVPAALRAIFGNSPKGFAGRLPINIEKLVKDEDGTWAYTDEVVYERGSGL